MTPEEVAKILDTEGCIGAAMGAWNGIYPHIEVGMTDESLPRLLYNQFGGAIHLQRKHKNPRAKPCWYWQVRGHVCEPILQFCGKFLLVKRLQGMYTLLLAETGGRRGHNPKRTPELEDLRLRLYRILRKLNGGRDNWSTLGREQDAQAS